jgi:hypothetical protein
MVKVTVPAVISAALGVYVAVAVVPFAKVPVPELDHKIVPLFETPDVVNVLPAHIVASEPAFEAGVLLSLSVIETTPAPSRMEAFVGSVKVIFIVSSASRIPSSIIGIVNVAVS